MPKNWHIARNRSNDVLCLQEEDFSRNFDDPFWRVTTNKELESLTVDQLGNETAHRNLTRDYVDLTATHFILFLFFLI